jgi:glycosyltransferase involved in cell wall biosynthesis
MRIVVLTTDNREPFKDYSHPTPYFGPAPEALLQGLAELPKEAEVHVVSCLQNPALRPEKIAENIWYHGLHVPQIGWLRTGYQGCIRAARKKIREINPDLVHGQGTERDCAISAVLSGFPSVITIHGNMNAIAQLHRASFGSFWWWQARLENFTLPRTKGIICISEYVANLVRKYGTKIWLVPNAIHQMFFDFPRQESAPLKKPLLINVGVISERKRQHELIKLLESLRAEGLEFDTLFIGISSPFPYATTFKTLLEEANRKHGGFQHIPKLDNQSFCQLYDRASAMIHFSNEESFGLTFAEAIARGLYLFASEVGAIRDIAQGVDRVEIIGLDKWDELKKRVRQWITSGAWKQPRPASPAEEFVQRYHPVAVARKHLEIYRSVIEEHQSKSEQLMK